MQNRIRSIKKSIYSNPKYITNLYPTLLPRSMDSSSMNRISGVRRSFIRLPIWLLTYLVLALRPSMATFFPLSSPNTDTYTLHTCAHRNSVSPAQADRHLGAGAAGDLTWRSLESSTSAMVVREER